MSKFVRPSGGSSSRMDSLRGKSNESFMSDGLNNLFQTIYKAEKSGGRTVDRNSNSIKRRVRRLSGAGAPHGGPRPTGFDAQARDEHERMRLLSDWMCVLSAVGMVLVCVENEVLWHNGSEPYWFTTALKAAVTVSTLGLMWVVYEYYQSLLRFLYFKHHTAEKSMVASTLSRPMVLELGLCALHVPPGMDWEFSLPVVEEGVKLRYRCDVLGCVVFLRFWVFLRLLRVHSPQYESTMRLRGGLSKVPLQSWYTVKAVMLERPWTVLSFFYIFSLTTASYCLRLWERGKLLGCEGGDGGEACMPSDLASYLNACWVVFATMSTVGFGDTVPVTHLGRAVAVVAQFMGQILQALVITVFLKSMEFTTAEARVFGITSDLVGRSRERDAAAAIIASAWKFHRRRKRLRARRSPLNSATPLLRMRSRVMTAKRYDVARQRWRSIRSDVPQHERQRAAAAASGGGRGAADAKLERQLSQIRNNIDTLSSSLPAHVVEGVMAAGAGAGAGPVPEFSSWPDGVPLPRRAPGALDGGPGGRGRRSASLGRPTAASPGLRMWSESDAITDTAATARAAVETLDERIDARVGAVLRRVSSGESASLGQTSPAGPGGHDWARAVEAKMDQLLRAVDRLQRGEGGRLSGTPSAFLHEHGGRGRPEPWMEADEGGVGGGAGGVSWDSTHGAASIARYQRIAEDDEHGASSRGGSSSRGLQSHAINDAPDG